MAIVALRVCGGLSRLRIRAAFGFPRRSTHPAVLIPDAPPDPPYYLLPITYLYNSATTFGTFWAASFSYLIPLAHARRTYHSESFPMADITLGYDPQPLPPRKLIPEK